MIPQVPAKGIMLVDEYPNAVTYKVQCDCTDNEHTQTVWVEVDDTNCVTVTTYTTQKTDWWKETFKKNYEIDNDFLSWLDWNVKGFINGFINKLRYTKNIWFDGYLKYEASIIMDEQSALNYAETLKTAINNYQRLSNNSKQLDLFNDSK